MASRISSRLARLECRHPHPAGCALCRLVASLSAGELDAVIGRHEAAAAAAEAGAAPPPAPPAVAKLLRDLRRTQSSPACEYCRRIASMRESELTAYIDAGLAALRRADAKAGAAPPP